MVDVARRKLLGGAAAGAGGLAAASVLSKARAAGFGDPDLPPQGAINATNPASLTDPGPQNAAIADQFPAAVSPPATATNDMQQFWASFNNAAKRISERRLGEAGHAVRLPDFRDDRRRQHAADSWRHTRTALA
jgi:oxalate decarboxylase